MLERTGRAILLSAAVTLAAPALAATIPSRLTADEFSLLAERLHQSGSYKVRIQAALLLGSAGGSDALPLLVAVLKDDPRASVRAAAALGLGALGDDRAYAPLVELVERDGRVRARAGRQGPRRSVPEAFRRAQALDGSAGRVPGDTADGHPSARHARRGRCPRLARGVERSRKRGGRGGQGRAAATSRCAAQERVAHWRSACATRTPACSAATMLADALDSDALPLLADAVSTRASRRGFAGRPRDAETTQRGDRPSMEGAGPIARCR